MNCRITIILAALLLAGCGPVLNPYQETFKCKTPDENGKCVDTTTAYKDARFPQPEPVQPEMLDKKNGCKDCDQKTDKTTPPSDLQAARYKVLAKLLQEPKKPLIEPPKILRVLMLPYEGEKGELFMTRHVYVQVEAAKWVLTDQHEKEAQR